MTPAQITVKINIAQREADYWREILAKRSCLDCQHWKQPGCGLANDELPPSDVQKTGCPEWKWDEIPF